MKNLAIVGLGHWGKNYVRAFQSIVGVRIGLLVDASNHALDKFSDLKIRQTQNYQEALDSEEIDAVVVSTPATLHYQIIKAAILAGKDVLAEKPITLSSEQAFELNDLAEKHKSILMVGHTFLYNNAVLKLNELVNSNNFGRVYYLNATRTHLGLIREDVSSVWDLAPHDLSIFNYILDSMPIAVSAIGACHLGSRNYDVAFVNLIYPNEVIANIHVSWEDSNKERTIRVVGERMRIVFNDMDNLERIKIFHKGVGINTNPNSDAFHQVQLRDGDVVSPNLQASEPLHEMCKHFVSCIENRVKPRSSGIDGANVVKILEAISKSIENQGQTVNIPQ
jgi:predicted dehydrogenase